MYRTNLGEFGRQSRRSARRITPSNEIGFFGPILPYTQGANRRSVPVERNTGFRIDAPYGDD